LMIIEIGCGGSTDYFLSEPVIVIPGVSETG